MSRSLQFDIVANDKASAKMKGVQNAAQGFAGHLTKYFAAFVGVQAIASRALTAIQQSFAWGASLKDTAASLGITVKELQQLEYVAISTGVSVEKLQTAFRELRKTMRDASQGGDQANRIMSALGYSQEQIASNSIDATDAFLRVSEAISAAKTEQEKFNIASAVFGDRTSLQMVQALGKFGELKKTIAETPLLSDKDAETLDRFDRLLDRIGKMSQVKLAELALDPLSAIMMASPLHAAGILKTPKIDDFMPTEEKEAAATDEAKARADALIAAGRKVGKGSGEMAAGSAGSNLLSAAAIGGAAGFRPGDTRSPVLSTLEQIEQNTRPTADIPVNGSTNFAGTDSQRREFEGAVARIRFPLKQGRPSARPAR